MTFAVFNLNKHPPLICGESDTGAYLIMNRNLLFLMAILVSASTNLPAQHGGMARLGRGSAPRAMSTTRPHSSRNSDRRRRDRSDFGDYDRYSDGGWLYPDYYDDYWDSSLYGHDAPYDFHPDLALVMPAQEPASPPPPPATPVVLDTLGRIRVVVARQLSLSFQKTGQFTAPSRCGSRTTTCVLRLRTVSASNCR